jgi:crotonobetainyl-CoA:carnitine CoA-transferase CaiB-like acyl-CoA transferase
MSSYDFLKGVTVLELAQLGPSSLGGYLADMGATVVKVESPGNGDPIRYDTAYAAGTPNGVSFLHLRWNRGKKSVALDLATPEGAELFKQLAAKSDVVIEGMRAGALNRLGLGFPVLEALNPRIVFCSISGFGLTGPYAPMPSHGPAFDAFAGLAVPKKGADISQYSDHNAIHIGMYALGLHAALGVVSALFRARTTNRGALIDVAGCDSAAHFLPDILEPYLNEKSAFVRPGFADQRGRMVHWSRLDNYCTKDRKLLYFQGLKPKFWRRFVDAIGQPELDDIYDRAASIEEADDTIAAILTRLFLTKTRNEWLELLHAHDVPVMSVNDPYEVVRDPHFIARRNTYAASLRDETKLVLTSTPIKDFDQEFCPDVAPDLGEHTDIVLSDMLNISAAIAAELRTKKIIG